MPLYYIIMKYSDKIDSADDDYNINIIIKEIESQRWRSDGDTYRQTEKTRGLSYILLYSAISYTFNRVLYGRYATVGSIKWVPSAGARRTI